MLILYIIIKKCFLESKKSRIHQPLDPGLNLLVYFNPKPDKLEKTNFKKQNSNKFQ